MGSQYQNNDDAEDINVPNYPPPAEPGDLVVSALRHYALTEADWNRFTEGLERFKAEWRTMLGHARRGVGIAPGWLKNPSERVQREAKRLEELGEPEWRLWNAWAEELRQQGM